ncbi:hypothetical protein ACOSQ4_021928 [Xanthoceras sorbifolium]
MAKTTCCCYDYFALLKTNNPGACKYVVICFLAVPFLPDLCRCRTSVAHVCCFLVAIDDSFLCLLAFPSPQL